MMRGRGASLPPAAAAEAEAVASAVSGSFITRARDRDEMSPPNPKTILVYKVVVRLWLLFCMQSGVYAVRWAHSSLSGSVWHLFMDFANDHSVQEYGLTDKTLRMYCRVLSHVLCAVSGVGPSSHRFQLMRIDQIVRAWVSRHPDCRVVPNTKSSWDHVLFEMAMRLADVWEVYGHMHTGVPAWFLFAKVVLSMLVYSGWRPFLMSRDRVADNCDHRWGYQSVLPCSNLWIHWLEDEDGPYIAAVYFGAKRTKKMRYPRRRINRYTRAVSDAVVAHALLMHDPVDPAVCAVCCVVAWLVVCLRFGKGALSVVNGKLTAGAATRPWTAALVEETVDSLWLLQPSGVIPEHAAKPFLQASGVLGNSFASGPFGEVNSSVVSEAWTALGMCVGLDPVSCSAVSGRKTACTATINHKDTDAVDVVRITQHSDICATTIKSYVDASSRNADTRNVLRGLAPRDNNPAMCMLARTRNEYVDMRGVWGEAGIAAANDARVVAATAARDAAASGVARRLANCRLAAVRKSARHRAFMRLASQRHQQAMVQPRLGTSDTVHTRHNFQLVDGTVRLSQQEYVKVLVKAVVL